MSNSLSWINATSSSDITSGLVSRWKMNEGTGTTVADDIGGITATLAGTPNPSWITGPSGNGALQSSGSARLNAGTTSTYSFMENTGIWSANFWFKTTDYTSGGFHTFWCTTDTSIKGVYLAIKRPGSNTVFVIQVRTAGGLQASFSDGLLSDNSWHMATFWSDGINVGVYLDASASGTPVSLGGTGTGNSGIAATFFDDTAADYFSGGIDDMRIYNRVLSGSEITTLFNNGAQ